MSPWPHVPDAIGTSPKCGVRKAGTDAGPGLGATQGKVGGVNTGALPAALSPLELWLLHKTLSEPQNRLPSARGAQSPAQGEWATSWGGTLEIPELDNMWFESQEAEEEEKEECGLADRDGLFSMASHFPALEVCSENGKCGGRGGEWGHWGL